VVVFNRSHFEDVSLVGGKTASLGENVRLEMVSLFARS
jgi:hypothetical protein